eukprot:GILJ01000144.1.p1 GENE.GILJ01000144.1~~GILJ01000144.1.p1  ORF type:complete len:417 (-),score=100.09 GILJ01000144.1:220-1470(-)
MARLVLLSLALLFASSLADWKVVVEIRTNKRWTSDKWNQYELKVKVPHEVAHLSSNEPFTLTKLQPRKTIEMSLNDITDLTPEIKYESTDSLFKKDTGSRIKKNKVAVEHKKVSSECMQLKLADHKAVEFGSKKWIYVCVAHMAHAARFRAIMCHFMKAKSGGVASSSWPDFNKCGVAHPDSPLPPSDVEDAPEPEEDEPEDEEEDEEEEDDLEFGSGSGSETAKSAESVDSGFSTEVPTRSMGSSPSEVVDSTRTVSIDDEFEEDDEPEEPEVELEAPKTSKLTTCPDAEEVARQLAGIVDVESQDSMCRELNAHCDETQIGRLLTQLTADSLFNKMAAKHNPGVSPFCQSFQRKLEREASKREAAAQAARDAMVPIPPLPTVSSLQSRLNEQIRSRPALRKTEEDDFEADPEDD